MKPIKYPSPVDLSKYAKNITNPDAYYGLPSEVKYCTKCVISNQRPNSTVEYIHKKDTKKLTINFDESGVCDACNFTSKKIMISTGSQTI
jgi:hypothetical protein